ncbi:MAG: beta propeller repeat protein [Planctomycetota bacterium]|jgi:hypothetical protein
MAVTTWTFDSGFEDWTFSDDSTANASAVRSHVPGAIRTTLQYDNIAVSRTALGTSKSPTLNATVQNGDSIALDYGNSSDGQVVLTRVTATYTDVTTETIFVINNGTATLTLTLTQNKTLDFIEFSHLIGDTGAGLRTTYRDAFEVRLTTVISFNTGERPLELEVDLENGFKVWNTKWKDAGLYLEQYSSGLILQNVFPIATGTSTSIPQINSRTYYMTPYCPPFFGTPNLNEIIYIFGRWDDGGVEHLIKSVNGGSAFSDIGDSGTWGGGWVGGFFADDANTLYAFVNGDSRALYRSTNGGSSWTNLSSLPFDVDPGGVSKHPDGRILIINRDTGAQMAAYAIGPDYSSWIDATGAPAFPTAGGGANAVAWVV